MRGKQKALVGRRAAAEMEVRHFQEINNEPDVVLKLYKQKMTPPSCYREMKGEEGLSLETKRKIKSECTAKAIMRRSDQPYCFFSCRNTAVFVEASSPPSAVQIHQTYLSEWQKQTLIPVNLIHPAVSGEKKKGKINRTVESSPLTNARSWKRLSWRSR